MDYFFILKMLIVAFYAFIGAIGLMNIIKLKADSERAIDFEKEIVTPELGAVVGATISTAITLCKLEKYEFQQEEYYLNLIISYRDNLDQAPNEALDDIKNELDEIHNAITSLLINHARKTRLLIALEALINDIQNRLGLTPSPPSSPFSLLNFSFFSPRSNNEIIEQEDQLSDENGQLSDEDSQPDDQRELSLL